MPHADSFTQILIGQRVRKGNWKAASENWKSTSGYTVWYPVKKIHENFEWAAEELALYKLKGEVKKCFNPGSNLPV
jgi:hypothetical protein